MSNYAHMAMTSAIVSFLVVVMLNGRQAPSPEEVAVPVTQADTLTDWELLQMAIIMTESRYNPEALGTHQDAGLYQMTPIYVAEINRIAGTDYTHADAFDPCKAVEMFATMQGHYNPEQDFDTALYYHNRSAEYRRRVLENLAFVKRYETTRRIVK